MASLTQWTWVWVDSRSWWWTERLATAVYGVAKSQTWLSDWTELNWTEDRGKEGFFKVPSSETLDMWFVNIFSHSMGYHFMFLVVCLKLKTPSVSYQLKFCLFFRIIFKFNTFLDSLVQFSSVQLLSCGRLSVIPWTAACQASLSHHQLLESTQNHVHCVSDAIQPSHPLSSPSPPALTLSQHQDLFKWVSSPHQSTGVSALASFLPQNTQGWSPSEWTGLDLHAVQGTLKSLLQHHCLKASMLSNLLFNFFSCTFCVSTAVLGTLLLLSCSVVSNSATQWTVTHHATSVHGILQALKTGVGCHFLLRRIFLT